MKITIQEGEFSYSYDDTVNNKIKDGMVEEGYTDAHGAIDAALLLLCNLYDRQSLIDDIREGEYSIM